jgi:hypothetical protein
MHSACKYKFKTKKITNLMWEPEGMTVLMSHGIFFANAELTIFRMKYGLFFGIPNFLFYYYLAP